MEKLRSFARNLPLTFESWLLSFAGIVLIRIFFEQLSSFQPGRYVLIDIPTIIHYAVFYVATTLALIIIFSLFSKGDTKEILSITILGLPIILLAPVIDIIFGGVGGHLMGYLFIGKEELFTRFFSFFGGYTTSGITLGIQIELVLGLLFCYFYTYSSTKNVVRAFGASLAFYCVIFIFVSIPSIIYLWSGQGPLTSFAQTIFSSNVIGKSLHPAFTATNLGLFDLAFNKIMAGIFTIIALAGTMIFFRIRLKEKFIAIIKNSRPERIFHFFLLFMFGASFVDRSSWFATWVDVESFVLALLAFTCAWLVCVCQNDIHDQNIDEISNPDRPLISEGVSRSDMQVASKILLIFALLAAYASSHYVLFFVSFFLLVYFVYSNPPLRLKKFVVVNSFLVSLACLSVIMGGFFLVSPSKNIIVFPPIFVLAIIIFFTAVANIRDIKDVEGDRRAGIKTLPVLLGAEKAKRLIAGIICFFFLLMPWYFSISLLWAPAIIASVLSWYFINQKSYKEWRAFVVYMLYLIVIIGFVTFR